MQQTSFVTGGLGFVGRHLVDALVAQNHKVLSADMKVPESRKGVKDIALDITDKKAVFDALQGVDTVFHCASLVHTKNNQVDRVYEVNVNGTQNVIDACLAHNVKRLIYVSSASVVYAGQNIENGNEDLPYTPGARAPYVGSKVIAEQAILAANSDKLKTVSIRPHVIFGPHDARFLPAILAHARAGRLRFQIGNGKSLSDFTYISNLIDSLLLADEKLVANDANVAGKAFFVTNGEPIAFWSFVKKILARLDLPPVRMAIPSGLVYAIAAVKEGFDTLRGGTLNNEDGLSRFAVKYMCTHHYFDLKRAKTHLGFTPKVSLDEGIELTCQYLKANGFA